MPALPATAAKSSESSSAPVSSRSASGRGATSPAPSVLTKAKPPDAAAVVRAKPRPPPVPAIDVTTFRSLLRRIVRRLALVTITRPWADSPPVSTVSETASAGAGAPESRITSPATATPTLGPDCARR